MLETTELIKLLRDKRIHWAVKANAVDQMVKHFHPEMQIEHIAWRLHLTFNQIQEHLVLASCLRNYPTSAKIPNKSIVLQLINQAKNQASLRESIARCAIKYKSKLQLKELKDNARLKFKSQLDEFKTRTKSIDTLLKTDDEI